MTSHVLFHSLTILVASLHIITITFTNGWLLKCPNLRQVLSVDVTAITLAIFSACGRIPTILRRDLMDINTLHTQNLTIR